MKGNPAEPGRHGGEDRLRPVNELGADNLRTRAGRKQCQQYQRRCRSFIPKTNQQKAPRDISLRGTFKEMMVALLEQQTNDTERRCKSDNKRNDEREQDLQIQGQILQRLRLYWKQLLQQCAQPAAKQTQRRQEKLNQRDEQLQLQLQRLGLQQQEFEEVVQQYHADLRQPSPIVPEERRHIQKGQLHQESLYLQIQKQQLSQQWQQNQIGMQ